MPQALYEVCINKHNKYIVPTCHFCQQFIYFFCYISIFLSLKLSDWLGNKFELIRYKLDKFGDWWGSLLTTCFMFFFKFHCAESLFIYNCSVDSYQGVSCSYILFCECGIWRTWLNIMELCFEVTLWKEKLFNGSQLAKMKKSIPDMSLPWNL